MDQQVDQPTHYQLPSGVEVIDVVESLGFCRGNAVKYLLRAGNKVGADTLTDLSKARWYIEREMAQIAADEALASLDAPLSRTQLASMFRAIGADCRRAGMAMLGRECDEHARALEFGGGGDLRVAP